MSSVAEARQLNRELTLAVEKQKELIALTEQYNATARHGLRLFTNLNRIRRQLGIQSFALDYLNRIYSTLMMIQAVTTSLQMTQGPLGIAIAVTGLVSLGLSLAVEMECPRY